MSRSKSFKKFSKTVHRAWLMANLRHGLIENEIIIGSGAVVDYDDLGRASIVLTIAAMDSYFTDAFIEKLVPFLKNNKPTKDLVRILEKAGIGVKEALELLYEKRPYERIRKILEQHLENCVTQNPSIINKLFIAYGFKDICKSAEGKCKSNNIITSVKKLVKRRHEIVHNGDYLNNGNLRSFSQSRVNKQVLCMEKFVNACDELLFP